MLISVRFIYADGTQRRCLCELSELSMVVSEAYARKEWPSKIEIIT